MKKIKYGICVFTLCLAAFSCYACGKNTAKDSTSGNNKASELEKDAKDTVTDISDKAGDAAKDVAKGAGNATKDAAKGAGNAAKGAGDAAKDAAKGAGDAVTDVADGAADLVTDVAEGAADIVDDLVNTKAFNNYSDAHDYFLQAMGDYNSDAKFELRKEDKVLNNYQEGSKGYHFSLYDTSVDEKGRFFGDFYVDAVSGKIYRKDTNGSIKEYPDNL